MRIDISSLQHILGDFDIHHIVGGIALGIPIVIVLLIVFGKFISKIKPLKLFLEVFFGTLGLTFFIGIFPVIFMSVGGELSGIQIAAIIFVMFVGYFIFIATNRLKIRQFLKEYTNLKTFKHNKQ